MRQGGLFFQLCLILLLKCIIAVLVADPDKDPDPAFFVNADLDPDPWF
jgi:hypothetical protein